MNGKAFLTIVFFSILATARAQQFGAFPPSTKWRQIKTDTARIIFEGAVDSEAQNVAAIIHKANRINVNPLGDKVRRISIVMHKNTTLANGYVALGPFRSEYYLIPGSNIFEFGATPWWQTLAVHEYRHVHQYSNFNTGLSHVASVIFGQEGQAAFNALAIPEWFFEGDAVHSETIETSQGRGRAPAFFNGFKAIWHEGRNFSWMKIRSGSLKDRIPNHYPLGYLLVNYGYEKYGADFWKKVNQDALTFHGLFGFYSGSVKKYSGRTWTQYRDEALDFYQHEVSTRRDAAVEHETVTDYFFPQQIGQDSLLYVKSSFRKLPAFYLRDKEGEHRIKLRSISNEDWFSYRAGTIAYAAYNTSARWSLVNYSNIILLNIATGEEKRITAKGKYFTPDISPDGSKILAVNFNDSLGSELHLLNRNGVVEKRISAPAGGLFVHPRFINNDEFVVALRDKNSLMSLSRGSLLTGGFQTLLSPGAATVGYPFVQGSKLYFVSSQSGNDDLFELDLTAKLPATSFRQLTFSQTGNYFPNVSGDSLIWSRFTSNGYRLQTTSVSGIKAVTLSGEDASHRALPFKIGLVNAPSAIAANNREFAETPYKGSSGLFNFHSWRPNYTDPEITYSLYSDNILNTFSNEIFYRYNLNETSHAVGFNSYFGGLFPVLNAGINYTFDRTIKTTSLTYTLNQFEAQGGFNIPLSFSGGKMYKTLNFGSNLVYNSLTPTGTYKNLLNSRTALYASHSISYSQQLPRAVQHIFPRFGYAVSAQHRQLITDAGFQSVGGVALYLPSIRNHAIVLAANAQETDTANITFSNRFANSRGYNDYYFSRMWRVSGNYHMPLFYPDGGIPGIVFVQRIRSNFFYDYTRVYSRSKLVFAEQRSVGGELYFDTKLFYSLPVSIGLRVSHLLDNDFSGTRPKGSNIFEVVLPLNLIPQ